MKIPLFPLSSTLFPDGLLHLKIFEMHYLQMTKKAFQETQPFGVVTIQEGSETRVPGQTVEFSHIGVLAHILRFEEVQPNLYLLLCKGVERFTILSKELQSNGLWMAEVSLLPPDPESLIPLELQETANKLGKVILSLQQHSIKTSEMPFSQPYRLDDCGWVANRWCEMLPLNAGQKELLLGQTNPRLRLDLINDILDEIQISIQFPGR
jgi:Lon protease-like protein